MSARLCSGRFGLAMVRAWNRSSCCSSPFARTPGVAARTSRLLYCQKVYWTRMVQYGQDKQLGRDHLLLILLLTYREVILDQDGPCCCTLVHVAFFWSICVAPPEFGCPHKEMVLFCVSVKFEQMGLVPVRVALVAWAQFSRSFPVLSTPCREYDPLCVRLSSRGSCLDS